ncbi:hypothetical protein [Geobacter sp.]|uniref:hypothetical protein n=1 Tax=Geobacter sp. TaxID=46610 RepID=UPI00260A7112|nr:hypothetical protein [Geobacter sp.]
MRLAGNEALVTSGGRPLHSLREINALAAEEKERIYGRLLPPRLLAYLDIVPDSLRGRDGLKRVGVIAPEGIGLVRLEVTAHPALQDAVFFLELADTQFRQMELSFCIIADPRAPRFDVDRDSEGRDNLFASLGRNRREEERAMKAGLFPNQTRRGLQLFGEFFVLFERFVDALGMEMIVAEPLTYDNAIRYEKYGFDYLTGKRLMLEIDRGFQPGGVLFRRLDGSSPFRMPGMERTVRGRSWAIHDGIMDEPWDGVRIYKMVGVHAGVDTFPGREPEMEEVRG